MPGGKVDMLNCDGWQQEYKPPGLPKRLSAGRQEVRVRRQPCQVQRYWPLCGEIGLGLNIRSQACPCGGEAGELEAAKTMVDWRLGHQVQACVKLIRRVACAVKRIFAEELVVLL